MQSAHKLSLLVQRRAGATKGGGLDIEPFEGPDQKEIKVDRGSGSEVTSIVVTCPRPTSSSTCRPIEMALLLSN